MSWLADFISHHDPVGIDCMRLHNRLQRCTYHPQPPSGPFPNNPSPAAPASPPPSHAHPAPLHRSYNHPPPLVQLLDPYHQHPRPCPWHQVLRLQTRTRGFHPFLVQTLSGNLCRTLMAGRRMTATLTSCRRPPAPARRDLRPGRLDHRDRLGSDGRSSLDHPAASQSRWVGYVYVSCRTGRMSRAFCTSCMDLVWRQGGVGKHNS